MNAVGLQDLNFFYEDKKNPVIKNLSLEIPKGSVTAVLGPNGAGKTTLLAILLGLLTPDSGEVFIFEKPCSQYPPKKVKQILGMVSQNETIPFELNVAEYVLLGRAPYLQLLGLPCENDITIAMDAMKTAGIDHMDFRTVPSLSSGERQLVSIARVLAQAPDILLFDEPTSHLDLPNSRKILKLMKAISQDEDRTIIFTTHDPNAAAAIADNIVLLGRQGLVAYGNAEHTFTRNNLTATYGEAIEVVQTDNGPFIMSL